MRKFGKYEKMRRNAIMQTYITSLLCLVLCVTMFFGTTMAWFTDTTVSQGNEMYVGTLDVGLNHASFMNGSLSAYAEVKSDYQVFKKIENGGIRWEPGYTAVEKFQLTENGDLAFHYQLGIERTFAESEAAQIAIANAITVWNYVGDDAESVTTLPVNFDELTAEHWEEIGSLYDVITNHLPVFKGQMDKAAVNAEAAGQAYHLIALHMDESFSDTTVQGQKLDNLTIKLVATQLHSEEDAFGSDYDAKPVDMSAKKPVAVEDNKVTEDVTVSVTDNGSAVYAASVTIPKNTAVEANTTEVQLCVKEVDNPTATVVAGKSVLPLEIKVLGVAEGNTELIKVVLNIEKNLPNVEVYHNGTKMNVAGETPASDTYTYNAATGALTLYVTDFSPFDVVFGYETVSDGLVKVNEGNYNVTNANGLLSLGGKSLEGTYTLVADIDLKGAAMPTIGAAYGKTLTFNGNGHTISNATTAHTNHNGMKHHGFFYAYTNSTLTISNLTFDNITIDATKDTERNYGTGVVVAYADGGSDVTLNNVDVKNSHVKNSTPDIGDEAGVYVGYQTGTLTMVDCDSTGCTVIGETTEKTGAFIGMVNGTTTMKNCTTDLTIGACNRVSGTLTTE